MHAVNEVDVSMTRRPEDHARAIGDAARGMRRQIVATQIGFSFGDDAGRAPVHQDLAEQPARDFHGVPRIE